MNSLASIDFLGNDSFAFIAQRIRAAVSGTVGRGFESLWGHREDDVDLVSASTPDTP